MGLYDTMNQAPTAPQSGMVNGTSAQKQPVMQQNAWQQKQQMRANPLMKGRPAMGQSIGNMQKPNNNFAQAAGGLMNAYMNRPNPTAGIQPGMQGGSRDMMQQKMQQLKAQQAAAMEPNSGNKILSTGGGSTFGSPIGGGLANLQTPYDQQQAQQPNAMQQAADQMRGYEGPDLGSQDPRELARMGQMGPLQGSVGQPMLQNAPYDGEQPGSVGFQSLMGQMGGQRPDVVRGLGPSQAQLFGGQEMQPNMAPPVQMDENGLEPRRGAR